MKDFITLAKERCSVRAYENVTVEEEKIDKILEAGRIAPSACNNQPWKFLVLHTQDSLEKLSQAGKIFAAPLAIIVLGEPHAAWTRSIDKKNALDIDASIATTHMMLAAEDMGLSTCWVCAFKPKVVIKSFNIPKGLVPINILTVGYAKGTKKPADRYSNERKSIDDIAVYESF